MTRVRRRWRELHAFASNPQRSGNGSLFSRNNRRRRHARHRRMHVLIKGEARTHTYHRSFCLISTSRLHACMECGHIYIYIYMPHACMLDHVRVHHAMCRPQANWLSLFPTLHSFNVVLARPRSVHLASSQGGGGTIEQCAQQVQESEVFRRFKLQIHSVAVCACSDGVVL